jgi:hypothetical protein
MRSGGGGPYGVAKVWCDDFWLFVKDIGRRPKGDAYLYPRDRSSPIGPGNWYWHKFDKAASPEESQQKKAARIGAWQRANADRYRDQKYVSRYGITLAQYDSMLLAQGGKCYICKGDEIQIDHRIKEIRRLAVDHDHATGKVRGLLCAACNRGIALFKEDPEILRSAILYLSS